MNKRWREFQSTINELEAFQKKVRKNHSKEKKRLIGNGGNENSPPFSRKPNYKRAESAPPGFNVVGEALQEEINDSVMKSFRLKKVLAPMLWDRKVLKDEIREKLIEIAKDFSKDWPFELGEEDILLTGSIANYNWSEYSDIDLHILVDYDKIKHDRELVSEYFHKAATVWNERHDILIKNHEVEIYVQDVAEEHFSTGVYSLLTEKWLHKPDRVVMPLDTDLIQQKAEMQISKIDTIQQMMDSGDVEEAHDMTQRLKKKMRKMRQTGLEDEGTYSVENMVFKVLRRTGELERLSNLKDGSYDRMMGVEQ